MNLRFSLYLDLIRFSAALAVFLNHVAFYPFTKGVVDERLGSYGDVAVTIFFVLSGYVIAHVVSTRERTAAQFFQSRAARLYSVVVIALPLTFLFDKLGMWINPDFYAIQEVLWKPESRSGYAASLVFLNEYQIFHFNGIAPGTNGPYWSLSFEATYYLIAGLTVFSISSLRILISVLRILISVSILALAGSTIVALLPIWMFGYFLYLYRDKIRLPYWASLPCFLLSALLLLRVPRISYYLPTDMFGLIFPWGERGSLSHRNILEDYIAAASFALHLIAARDLFSSPLTVYAKSVSSIRWLGSLTFPMYCIHYPAICMLTAISPWATTTFANLAFVSSFTLVLVAVITPFCDLLKNKIRSRLFSSTRSSSRGCRVA
jgi:peptidoglycan/LPS O-acetylase OafA/YrhL